MKVYSIIVTYNGEKWIEKCLTSLNRSTIKTEILVIDNDSSDTTLSIIESKFPTISLAKLSTNIGFGQANNIGLKRAIENGADNILLINQDAYVSDTTIERLVEIQNSYPEFGVLSPIHLNGSGTALDSGFATYASPQFGCYEFLSDSYLNKLKNIYETQFVNAACWLISAGCVKKIGGFDPLFFHYGEDENYVQRVLFHGYKIGICTETSILHDRGEMTTIKKDFDLVIRERFIELADVNKTETKRVLSKYIRSHFFRIIKLFCLFKYSKLSENYKLMKFTIKFYRKIVESVARNRTPGLTWL